MTPFFALLVCAYLLGSVPFGLVVAWFMGGTDPRLAGSANIGAANVYRLLGRNAGAFTLFGDIMKGAVPVFLARFGLQGLNGWHEAAVASVGLAAVCGHIWPLYLGFKGGKAVATSFGVLLVLCPLAALVLTGLYRLGLLAVAHIFRGVIGRGLGHARRRRIIVCRQNQSLVRRHLIRFDSVAAPGKYYSTVPGGRAGIDAGAG